MPAKVLVSFDSGEELPEYWIQEDVIRIGSDEECDIVISRPGVAAHALTIEYEDESYQVHPRQAANLTLEGRPHRNGEVFIWPLGETLEFGSGIRLQLVGEGYAAPQKKAAVIDLPPQEDDPDETAIEVDKAESAAKAKKKKDMMQLSVIGLCFVALFLILRGTKSGSQQSDQQRFDAIIDQCLKLERESAGDLGDLRIRRAELQALWADESAPGAERAVTIQRYQDLLHSLEIRAERCNTFGEVFPKQEQEMLKFVRERILKMK